MREATRGDILIRVLDGRDDLVDADSQRGQGVRLDLDENLPRQAAVDVDARHAGLVLERLHDRLIGKRRELAQIGRLRLHSERRDRLVVLVLDAVDERVLDVLREAGPHRGDLVAHVLNRLRGIRR